MHHTLEDLLTDIAQDNRYPEIVRVEAARLLEQWHSNVTPSITRIRKLLSKANIEPATCGQLQRDGSCVWLRKNAMQLGLPRVKPGEKAYCYRAWRGNINDMYSKCPGYRKG